MASRIHEVKAHIFPAKINGFPVKVLKCPDSTGCYMTIKCVEKCHLLSEMDTKCPGYITCVGGSKMPLLGTIQVPMQFRVKLSNGEMNEVSPQAPVFFYVTKTDVAEVVLGNEFPATELPGNRVRIGGGIVRCLPRDEWDEPARSCAIISTRGLFVYESMEEQA